MSGGHALALPKELSASFNEFLSTQPWEVSNLDWARMPRSESISTVDVDRRSLLAWARKTRIASHSHIAVFYSARAGGIVVPTEFAIVSLDELYGGAPGVRFAFGVDVLSDQMVPTYGDLLQYGQGDTLIAVGV